MPALHLSDRLNADGDREPWLRPELIAPWWEIVLVLALMLGPFIYSSTRMALSSEKVEYAKILLSNHKFLRLMAEESFLLAAFFGYLRWRGWRPADFQIRIDANGTLASLGVLVVATVANIAVALLLKTAVVLLAPHPHGILAAFIAHAPHIARHSIDVSWFLIVVGSTVNAYLEELVFMGYAFNQFAARRGFLFAMLVMVFLRMLLHTYKGPLDMIGIAAFSFVYAFAYRYLGRLWPLIVAHALVDIGAFSMLKLIFGR